MASLRRMEEDGDEYDGSRAVASVGGGIYAGGSEEMLLPEVDDE